jgi:hypothetical protein
VLRRKIKIVMAEKLKPFGYPKDPIGIIRCRYKYSKDNEDYYILADFAVVIQRPYLREVYVPEGQLE